MTVILAVLSGGGKVPRRVFLQWKLAESGTRLCINPAASRFREIQRYPRRGTMKYQASGTSHTSYTSLPASELL